ncbi:His-Xaa-Ser system-associated MauG-like protein [uncultured Roseibium sp.]|uniref:His-Xaa-Ser system-associated MauG-like protein n=1 Tax=uncultured Roseibium sp. TaxID=1936171 RepID=UPI00260E32F3|nr:His-Xaa-Ser system-associated MauG-like protein [uncultured Roseibium sp.]
MKRKFVIPSLLAAGFWGGDTAANTPSDSVSDITKKNSVFDNLKSQHTYTLAGHRSHSSHRSPESLVQVGKMLFESRLLSLAEDTACASCHLDKFGSADGLPIAIGTEGEGIGIERVIRGGDIIPRNVLPLWGRGGKGFDVLFWDGKVEQKGRAVHSQFGDEVPSNDPLIVAAHLPPVEIGEMLIDNKSTLELQTETVETANSVYETLIERVREKPELGDALAKAQSVSVAELEFSDVAEAIATFIRSNFRVKPTKFHDFVFRDGSLSPEEIKGGLIFYGKGNCVACHNGPYFSDMGFHAIASPQVGFGKNGFGVDYGRFNVTLNVDDKYLFRTPPLYNVTKTAPYMHSGSVYALSDAIRIHYDPLLFIDPESMTGLERVDFYDRLKTWSQEPINGVVLDDREFAALEKFLAALSYNSELPIRIID